MDGLLAASIIVIVILVSTSIYIKEKKTGTVDYLAYDMVRILSGLKVSDLDNEYVVDLINQGNITRPNNTILEQIGEYWAEDKMDLASQFAINISESLIPQRFGMGIWVDDELIYTRSNPISKSLVSSRKLISGITKDKPIHGYSSRAFLRNIANKTTRAYAYFGGFVGQGNITRYLDLLPDDAIVTSSFVEVDAGSLFQVYINTNYCDSLTPVQGNMSPTVFNISDCNDLFLQNIENNITFKFLGEINESYIAGGFVRVEYLTKQYLSDEELGIEYYDFPGIDGLINLYSSFDIPGTLNSMDLLIHFYNNKTTYLNIGNQTIFTSTGSSVDQWINITGLAFGSNPQTIPIRMGVGNISEGINITSGEPADSVLVTDVSGSMQECGLYSDETLCRYECCFIEFWDICIWWVTRECSYEGSCTGDQCGTCASGRTRNHEVVNDTICLKNKLELAQEADLLFVDTVLNLSGNRVGLVSYESDVDSTEPLTDINLNLENEILGYTHGGATCICCGINRAKDMLLGSTNKQFMVVMSDGEATLYCDNFNDYTGSGTGSTSDAEDRQWAIDAGQNACTLGITVFAVGFGEDADEDTLRQVACNESLYYDATNASKLTEIYEEIGKSILVIANFSSQIITVQGDYSRSMLYPDSYIRFNYTLPYEEPQFGEIEIITETDKFNTCDPVVDIPEDIRVTEAKALSYSGEHWSSILNVNDNLIFNISDFGSEYEIIGDPFIIQILPANLQTGANNLHFETADDPLNSTGCSHNNSLIYTALIPSSIDYGEPLFNASGCLWYIELEDSSITQIKAPTFYNDTKECNYTSSEIIYNTNDAYDVSVFEILSLLDIDDDGRLDINFQQSDLVIDYVVVRDVPSLWGPAVIEVRVWE